MIRTTFFLMFLFTWKHDATTTFMVFRVFRLQSAVLLQMHFIIVNIPYRLRFRHFQSDFLSHIRVNSTNVSQKPKYARLVTFKNYFNENVTLARVHVAPIFIIDEFIIRFHYTIFTPFDFCVIVICASFEVGNNPRLDSSNPRFLICLNTARTRNDFLLHTRV